MTGRQKESMVWTWMWAQRSVLHTINFSAAVAPTPYGSSNAVLAGTSTGTTKSSVAGDGSGSAGHGSGPRPSTSP